MTSDEGSKSLRDKLQHVQSIYRDDLTREEALALLIETAELHMKLLKIVSSPQEKADLRKTTQALLSEAEELKTSASWNGSLRGFDAGSSSASLPQTVERNLRDSPAVDVATITSSTPSDLDLSLSSPIGRSNNDIPTASESTLSTFPRKPAVLHSVPISSRKLSKREQILLLSGSALNKAKFPPWDKGPIPEDTHLLPGRKLFEDSFVYNFSEDQLKIFDSWKRPTEALPPSKWPADQLTESSRVPIMTAPSGETIDLVQDAATDCSVVASMCVCISRAEKGHPKLLGQHFFPYDQTNECPAISPNGKYFVKLNFNGCARKVMVDDRLPVSQTKYMLHAVDRHHPNLLWPAIMEKAYLKVRGGYDFPGSNSGTDLWILSGWVPEQIFVEDLEVDREELWNRIFHAFEEGNVLVTLGTGELPEEHQKELGLAGEHDYAVLDLKEKNGRRMMLIKNPWFRANTRKSQHEGGKDAPAEEPATREQDDSLIRTSTQTPSLPPGQFWMDLDSVMNDFASIYLNWNPALFAHRQDLHFDWDLSGSNSRSAVGSFGSNPQYTITSPKGGLVWVLLSKHFKDSIPEMEQLVSVDDDRDPEKDGFISLCAFYDRSHRVILTKGAAEQGPFVDSPQTLLKLHLSPGKPYTIVVSEQQLHPIKHTFTLSTFSDNPLSLIETPARFPKHSIISGSWTPATAGGNAGAPTYSSNPQISLTLTSTAHLSLHLETPTPMLNIHLKLMHGHGQRVYAATPRDIVIDSKDYRRGCALAESTAPIDKGTYTIVVSTFEAGQKGDFMLRAFSDVDIQMKHIPREGAGRIAVDLAPASFAKGVRCVAAPLRMFRLCKISLLATHVDTALSPNSLNAATASAASPRSPIRLTIERGREFERYIAIASAGGSYSDSASGVRTEDVSLGPDDSRRDELWLVLERLGGFGGTGRAEERIAVRAFADAENAFVCGVWRELDRSV